MTDHNEQLDQATRDRLGKLASMPVDLSRLETKLARQLPPPKQAGVARARPIRGWLRLAAMVALFAGVAAVSYVALFGVGPQTAVAQTMTVAELHEHLLSDRQQDYLAPSTDAAQHLIDAQLSGERPLPILDGTRVQSCCLVEGNFPLRAALVIEQPAGAITIIIAQGDNFAYSMNPIDHPSGVNLQTHEHAGIPMVMRNKGDLWMCVMGDVNDKATLAEIAASLEF